MNELRLLATELSGVIADVEYGSSGFDSICLATVKRVEERLYQLACTELAAQFIGDATEVHVSLSEAGQSASAVDILQELAKLEADIQAGNVGSPPIPTTFIPEHIQEIIDNVTINTSHD